MNNSCGESALKRNKKPGGKYQSKKGEGRMKRETGNWRIGWIFVLCMIILIPFTLCNGAEDPAKFPSKPITMIIPYAAGGSSDMVGRKLAELASKYIKQSIVAEVKPGGAGVLGTSLVANAAPDGYTLLLASDSMLYYVPHQRSVPYDPREFTYIIQVTEGDMPFVVRTDSKYKTFKEFVEEARKSPGKLKYQSQGPKSAGHVQAEYVFWVEKVKVIHIPGAGASEVIRQLLGGHVDAGITAGLGPQIKAGTIRPLAVAAETRNRFYAESPTFHDLGYKAMVPFGAKFGVVGPKGLPPGITKKLHDAFKKAHEEEAFATLMDNMLTTRLYKDSEGYRQYSIGAYETVGQIIRDLGLRE
jgi:tripartite-type tricarboxylate transporter receptor subunit TctC